MPSLTEPFPLQRITEIENAPERFRLLEQIPLTAEGAVWPWQLHPPQGDETELLVLDLETTGIDSSKDRIIELGMVKVSYSAMLGRVTAIEEVAGYYEDPGLSIPPFITRLTGINNEMVRGKALPEAEIATWLASDPLMVAHNARFDRQFFELRFPEHDRLRWACTSAGIDWSTLGFESRKLEYLLYRSGWFYGGHRATTDCLAVAWLLHHTPQAFAQLLEQQALSSFLVRAVGAPFNAKDELKNRSYRWQANDAQGRKYWWKEVAATEMAEEEAFLDTIYRDSKRRPEIMALTARTRYKDLTALSEEG
ncbi:MAG: DNA polymerase III subunit epsilon [Gammaproteobacteria bacterium]|nr:DNA polymerase III subunit epsilon [Gammaproteobacteria bacterium]